MYIDSGRVSDLQHLQKIIDDSSQPLKYRKSAHRVKRRILQQMRDKQATRLRERLMRAAKGGSEYTMWKITNQIKETLGEERIEWWSTKDER